MKELSNEAPPPSGDFNQGFQLDGNNNLYNYPHKGIFHPEPNTLICRGNCCFKYVGLYPMLFGLGFGCTFIPIGIFTKMIVFTIIGSIIFLASLIVGICLCYNIKTEIKFDNEQAIWQVLSAVVRESIGKYNDVKYLALGTGAFSMKYTIAEVLQSCY